MMAINFTILKLIMIDMKGRCGPGCVSATWDGAHLHVVLARPETGKAPFIMTFNEKEDYEKNPTDILADFNKAANSYFSQTDERKM